MSNAEDILFKVIFVLIFIVGLFFILFVFAKNELPDKIKDTNCIYYEEQIYCLQENKN